MKIKRYYLRIYIASLGIIALLFLPFFLRKPLILVSDHYFDALYGKNRTLTARFRTSLLLSRPVRCLSLDDSIGPDGIAFAVSEISEEPFAVCFPYRYRRGAELYQSQYPGVQSILLAGREQGPPVDSSLSVISTNSAEDFYRAGLAAALLSGKTDGTGTILCYIDSAADNSLRESFILGLRDGGAEADPVFINTNDKYVAGNPVSVAVLLVYSDDPFLNKLDSPIILFSWVDPGLLPSPVKIVFSDSPWEMIIPALKAAGKGQPPFILASAAKLISGKGLSLGQKLQLKRALTKKIPYQIDE